MLTVIVCIRTKQFGKFCTGTTYRYNKSTVCLKIAVKGRNKKGNPN